MQTQSRSTVDKLQQDALENGAAVFFWDKATLLLHSGAEALDLLHRLTTKELLSVKQGRAQRTVMASSRGRVVDALVVANLGNDNLLLISDSSEPARTISAISYYTIIEDAVLEDLSETHLRASLTGRQADNFLNSEFGQNVDDGNVLVSSVRDYPLIVVSDGSRGVRWIDLVYPRQALGVMQEKLEQAGVFTVDQPNFEFFRISHGIPGFDSEYGDHSNPIEAGLLDLIDFDKGCYVGQEVIARLDTYDKVKRNLRVIVSYQPVDPGCKLHSDSRQAGVVTSSSTLATEDGKYLSLGLVNKSFLEPGEVLDASGTSVTVW